MNTSVSMPLDAVTSRIIRDLLAGYVARGSTVFLTSHILEIVEKVCSHVGIIVKGQLVEHCVAGEPIARQIVLCDGDGVTSSDLRLFTYRNRRRPLFPFERDL